MSPGTGSLTHSPAASVSPGTGSLTHSKLPGLDWHSLDARMRNETQRGSTITLNYPPFALLLSACGSRGHKGFARSRLSKKRRSEVVYATDLLNPPVSHFSFVHTNYVNQAPAALNVSRNLSPVTHLRQENVSRNLSPVTHENIYLLFV